MAEGYVCGKQHKIVAVDMDGREIDLSNCPCPVCIGRCKDEMMALSIPMLLAPIQAGPYHV